MGFPSWLDSVSAEYLKHSSAPRVNTEVQIAQSLRAAYPERYLAIVPSQTCDLLSYADSGWAECSEACRPSLESQQLDLEPANLENLPQMGNTLSHRVKVYVPPSRRMDGATGELRDDVIFDKFDYTWNGRGFKLFIADGRDGSGAYPARRTSYLVGDDQKTTDALILAAAQFQAEVHNAVLVYEGGEWTRSTALYESAMKASWEAVILDEGMKKALIEDHMAFFDSREKYRLLGVPWKRGVIYYGPPGNGKTISIKAMMHSLYDRTPPVPTLYVRNLVTWAGPEAAIKDIFSTARQHAPCYLIFEDLDSLIGDSVRSYFLNEIDGLKANDGIFMVGSTNHLDRLDPGLSKRPSRFDRKYLFPNPDTSQREAYCRFWQRKLSGNDDIAFPDLLCKAIAEITHGFSYAYMQEAFVAALLAIAREDGSSDDSGSDTDGDPDHDETSSSSGSEGDEGWVDIMKGKKHRHHGKHHDKKKGNDDEDLDRYVLWREVKNQVKILREGMAKED
ncbi:putative ATPase YjoB [Ceratocystis platani]|uniref:Putative ATPase YjoB n=1 Tax=Ceratocystis fimbriata f. sp. platani TaxID=88771 RepID=A0A0F8AY51_CERFI|nr:putative ATPase YjoB [Ceratocystis platani]